MRVLNTKRLVAEQGGLFIINIKSLSVPNNGQRSANSVAQRNSNLPNGTISDTIDNNYNDDSDFEVIYDGEQRNESSGRDGERTDGVAATESGSSVQRRSRKKKTGSETQRRRAESIKNNVNAEGVERVTTASLGISIGTNNPTLQVVPRNLYTEEMKAVSKEQFAKGRRVIFFVGQLEMKQNGETFTARGALSKDGKRIWIQADHPSLTIEQIAKHEEFHALIKKDADLLDRTRRQIIAQYGEAELQELVDSYIDSYGWTELSDNYILEEILADAYAEIDVFDYLTDYEGATRFSNTVQESAKSVQDISSGIENDTGQEQFSRSKGTDFLIRNFTGKVNDETGTLDDMEYATISSNIKTGNAVLSKNRTLGRVVAHARNEVDYYYLFRFNADGSVTVCDILDYHSDMDDISEYERSFRSEKFSRNSKTKIDSAGLGPGTQSSNNDVYEKAKEGGHVLGVVGEQSQGHRTGSNKQDYRDSQNSRTDNKTPVAQDNEGNVLSKEQSEFFKDSKARDAAGRLVKVYHGTRKADFTVFRRNVSFFTDSREMADSYAPVGEMYEGYVNITKPYEIDARGAKWSGIPVDNATKGFLEEYGSSVFRENGEWRTTPADIAAAVEEAVDNGDIDYDGIIIRNVDDTGSYYKDDSTHLATDYITFKSNQFKNADNINPTSDPDIRFSRESSHHLQEQNEELQKQVEALKKEAAYWKNQTKRTTQPTLRDSDIKKLTTSLLSDYSSKADKTSVATALKNIGEFIVRGGDQYADLEWSTVKEKAVDIARNILENASELANDGNRATYKEIRHYLRTTKLHIKNSHFNFT